MEPLDYLVAVQRHWRAVLACVLLAAVGAVVTAPAASSRVEADPVTYTATLTLLQEPESTRNLDFTQLFMERGQVPQRVAAAMDLTPEELVELYTIEVDGPVGSITITATERSAERAELLAATISGESIAFFEEQARTSIDRRLGDLNERIATLATRLQELDERLADAPSTTLTAERDAVSASYRELYAEQQAISLESVDSGLSQLEATEALQSGVGGLAPPTSRPVRLALGAALGLLLGVALALLLDRVDTRVRRRDDLETTLGAPVVAEIPSTGRREHSVAAVVDNPTGEVAEAYRSLRSALTLLPARSLTSPSVDPLQDAGPVVHQPPSSVVLLTGCRGGEGTSATVLNLAATVAASGRSVVLVDADLRRPVLADRLGLSAGPGLADLAGRHDEEPGPVEVERHLRETRLAGVRLLTAGNPEAVPGVVTTRLGTVVRATRRLADVVLIDSGPLLGATGALDLMPHVDSAVLVVRAGRTATGAIRHAGQVLGRMRVPVLGAVLVGATQSRIARLVGQDEYTGRRPHVQRSMTGS